MVSDSGPTSETAGVTAENVANDCRHPQVEIDPRWAKQLRIAKYIFVSRGPEAPQLENWIEYIQRPTHIAEDLCTRYGITDWVTRHYQLKFKLAGHMARRTDSRWSTRILYWRPLGGGRCQGRPCQRWTDDLDRFFKASFDLEPGGWRQLTFERKHWSSLSDSFVEFCLNSFAR